MPQDGTLRAPELRVQRLELAGLPPLWPRCLRGAGAALLRKSAARRQCLSPRARARTPAAPGRARRRASPSKKGAARAAQHLQRITRNPLQIVAHAHRSVQPGLVRRAALPRPSLHARRPLHLVAGRLLLCSFGVCFMSTATPVLQRLPLGPLWPTLDPFCSAPTTDGPPTLPAMARWRCLLRHAPGASWAVTSAAATVFPCTTSTQVPGFPGPPAPWL